MTNHSSGPAHESPRSSDLLRERRSCIIANPASGKGRGLKVARALGEGLESRGWTCTHVETAAAGDAARAAEESARSGCSLVVAVGGDGTVQEVASGVVRADGRTVVAHVPTGTTNATARALGVPSDVDDAIASIEDGHAIELDAGFLPDSGDFFLFMTTIGAPARMIRDAPR
ncbi:MAG: acylglycerol kinase family protein, partial [Candidatus Krumholzibacteriia bacterium]